TDYKLGEWLEVSATGGASKARMPEMNAQRLCRTQSQQSVHKEARMAEMNAQRLCRTQSQQSVHKEARMP
ncbi:MAG: hypothetical protein ACLST1_06205, partial [[Eubacterium] siraeum]